MTPQDGREEIEAAYPGLGLGDQLRDYEDTLSAFTVIAGAFFGAPDCHLDSMGEKK